MSELTPRDTLLRIAILDIFRRHQAQRGAQIPLTKLQSEWGNTGFTHSELIKAAELLITAGHLVPMDSKTPSIALSESGYLCLHAPLSKHYEFDQENVEVRLSEQGADTDGQGHPADEMDANSHGRSAKKGHSKTQVASSVELHDRLLGIFRDENITAQGTMLYSVLSERWLAQDLTTTDLTRGLKLLISDGKLEPVPGDKPKVRLSPVGAAAIKVLSAPKPHLTPDKPKAAKPEENFTRPFEEEAITSSTLRHTIMDIYRRLNVGQNGRLLVSTLQNEWQLTGLAQKELQRSIDLAVEEQLLAPTGRDKSCLALTPLGSRFVQAPMTPRQAVNRWAAARAVQKARTDDE